MMSLYFLFIEVFQLVGNPSSYIKKWKSQLIEWISPILIVINCVRLILTRVKEIPGQELSIGAKTYTLQEDQVLDEAFWIV
jgi:hypothetical protein